MKVKIQDVKNPKVIKEVEKTLAGDFIGTGNFKLYEENTRPTRENKPKEEQENTNTSRFTMNNKD